MLVPLVAFDDAGIRLGMGGGYYDATFGAHGRALLIGLAHELQHHAGLPHRAVGRAARRGDYRTRRARVYDTRTPLHGRRIALNGSTQDHPHGSPDAAQSGAPAHAEELASAEIKRLLVDMIDTLKDSGGIGLAAPQVDEPMRLAIIEMPRRPEPLR